MKNSLSVNNQMDSLVFKPMGSSEIAISNWPTENKKYNFKKVENDIENLKIVISTIRNIKIDLDISSKKQVTLICRGEDKKTEVLIKNKHHLEQLTNIHNIKYGIDIDKPSQSATAVVSGIELFLPLKGLIDINKEISRLNTKLKDIEARLNNVKKKLDNDNFINKAPKEIIAHEQKKYDAYLADYNKLKYNYNSLTTKK